MFLFGLIIKHFKIVVKSQYNCATKQWKHNVYTQVYYFFTKHRIKKLKKLLPEWGLNPRPLDHESTALPTELP